MKIALITPAAAGSRSGNRQTATRWATFLRAAGHRVTLMNVWTGQPADLLLALHARRSHASIDAFRTAHPDRPLLLALTGTDVYRDIHEDPLAQASLLLADRFIVLQPGAIEELPRGLRPLAGVVYQSCASLRAWKPVRHGFRISVLGHLRDEKDPLRAGRALAHVPRTAGIRIVQLGAALDATLGAEARALQERDPRYRWLESVPHARALAWLASSHAMVISSRMEGGANVVSEAIRIGVPVLASYISGNIGLLGSDYPAYFRTGDDRALAKLMVRAATDRPFFGLMRRHILALQPLVEPSNEASMLQKAVTETAILRSP